MSTTGTRERPAAELRNGRTIRRDALPEHWTFYDEGCEFAPSCLRCPLERCRYDERRSSHRLRRGPRDEAIRVRRAEGADVNALAAEYGLSRRSVFRILKEGR